MLKQSSSIRNQKGKGYHSKVKLALQICLLVAISIWLVYQATQFSNQKAAYQEGISRSSKKEVVDDDLQERNGYRMLKLGRKNLDPRLNNVVVATSDSQKEMETSEDDESGAGNDDLGLGNQEKTEEVEHEQLEDLIDEDDNED